MAGSDRTEFRIALAALLAAVLGVLLERVAPSVHLGLLALAAQAGLWALCGVVHFRRRFNHGSALRRRSWSAANLGKLKDLLESRS